MLCEFLLGLPVFLCAQVHSGSSEHLLAAVPAVPAADCPGSSDTPRGTATGHGLLVCHAASAVGFLSFLRSLALVTLRRQRRRTRGPAAGRGSRLGLLCRAPQAGAVKRLRFCCLLASGDVVPVFPGDKHPGGILGLCWLGVQVFYSLQGPPKRCCGSVLHLPVEGLAVALWECPLRLVLLPFGVTKCELGTFLPHVPALWEGMGAETEQTAMAGEALGSALDGLQGG